MDDLSVTVSPKPKRSVTFAVNQQEAQRIVNFLDEAFTKVDDRMVSEIRHVRAGFKAIADDREFGGH